MVLAWIVVFLSSDVYLIFLVFQKQELENSLMLLDTKIEVSQDDGEKKVRTRIWDRPDKCANSSTLKISDFLVASTRLYNPLCWSVGWSVGNV